ncbi:MAG: prepilin-type N-terminal cleavage/methylation domain-containing protein [Halomonas sp.]|nr:prepilin-type N-terminal cleavage/methylation domain-containing protein [Halomonas sp.]
MLTQRQSGFTLVELMVAMVIGTVIILGAGQLFLTTFQTFQKVDELSRKQETVVFVANRLSNEYRKGNTDYGYERTRDSNGNELEECSVMEASQPIVGGLALYEDQCVEDRFVQDEVEVVPGEPLEGYYRFTLDFERADDELETLSFHVMQRPQASCLPPGTEDEDAFLQPPDRVPSAVEFIDDMKSRDEVVRSCNANDVRASDEKYFYCDDNINNFDVSGMDGKVIMAEQGISFEVNDNQSVSDLAIVAKNAINMNGNDNVNATLEGLFWSEQNISLGSGGVSFKGSILSSSNYTTNNFISETPSPEAWCLLEPYYSVSDNIKE